MTGAAEFAPRQSETEETTIHVLWLTSGLGCDGDSISMTAATSPSLEDILEGTIPGTPRVELYTPVLALESGGDFMRHFYAAEEGEYEKYILVVEGSIANEELSGEGHWSGFGVDPVDGQPITTNEWIDRLAPKAQAVIAVGTCATYGGIPAMKNNPTGAMGLPDYLGWQWRSRHGLPIICVPGCPAQPDNITEVLLHLIFHLVGRGPAPELDEQLRPRWLFEQTTREGCTRAGFTEQGQFATTYGDDPRCLVKLGCKGPVVKCNVPRRGWVSGVGGCPNVGGICMACTMPSFPNEFMPFMQPDAWGDQAANVQRFTYGPIFRYFRKRNISQKAEREPGWRRPGQELLTGYMPHDPEQARNVPARLPQQNGNPG